MWRDPDASRLRAVDLAGESIAGILQRPSRTAMTLVGIVLGIGAFVAVLGITSSATGQISKQFTEIVATEVTVEDLTVNDPNVEQTAFPVDAEARILAVNGVRYAGTYWTIPASRMGGVTGVPLPGTQPDATIPVVATSPGLADAVRAHLVQGRAFDPVLNGRGERVAVLGGVVARQLGITRLDIRPVVVVDGIPVTVIGIVDRVDRHPELLAAVWVPRGTAERYWAGPADPGQPPRMIIDTRLGAAAVVAQQAPLALRPDVPDSLKAIAPPDPRELRDRVDTQLSALFLVLAAISLLVGAVGIANTTLVAVLERVPEIGLRRALGAQRRHVAAQFLAESTFLGTIGGLMAAGIGVAVVVAVAVSQEWTPALEPWTVVAAPVVGGVTGLVSGLYPAIRASRIEPVAALRH
ncbi:ABC transporter permease [Micromonospora zhanjiangensis]|uniref:ABC transporter permease n=1 Tax=Micromonospora zhanjiangensis TaxID=1522057 RepID=A0ABV8KU10_9ACTN